MSVRPTILLLVDRPNWAFDTVAKNLSRFLTQYSFEIKYVVHEPEIDHTLYELIVVFFWGEDYHHRFRIPPSKVVKQVASHRWAEPQYGSLTPAEFSKSYLGDAEIIFVVSPRLFGMISPHKKNTYLVSNGFDPQIFSQTSVRSGPMQLAWAGNIKDSCKGVLDILLPAAKLGNFSLNLAKGDLSLEQMANFYNHTDIICIASTYEGTPLPLIEAMACGCFAICTDVGIVPQVIHQSRTGLIVNRDIHSFAAAFQWCNLNLKYIRHEGHMNSRLISQSYSWPEVINYWNVALKRAINYAKKRQK